MAKKKNNKKRDIKVYLIVLWSLFVLFGFSIYLLFHGITHEWFGDMPTFEELENPETNLATEIISADGKLLGTYYIENRSNVSYENISPYLINAIVAIEDVRFYEHSGIDKRALLRVFLRAQRHRQKSSVKSRQRSRHRQQRPRRRQHHNTAAGQEPLPSWGKPQQDKTRHT